MNLEEIREGFSSMWGSMAEGWQQLRQSAGSALTGFKPSTQTNMPTKSAVDDAFYQPALTWSMVGGDLFEDEKRVVVRLELPGIDKNDLDIEVRGDSLVIRGEKRFEQEKSEGRYRVVQCAYGSFQRIVPLPAAVVTDQAKATCKNGVLRVELPKAESGQPRKFTVKVD